LTSHILVIVSIQFMAPRRYARRLREVAREGTRRRIVDAVVALHAERGVLGTTYADVAHRADVSVATVYNHFPARADLLHACGGELSSRAPRLDAEMFAGIGDVRSRLAALVRAVFDDHRHWVPWKRWVVGEASVVPELRASLENARTRRLGLVVQALAPGFAGSPPAGLVALVDALLDFSAWSALTSDLGPEEAEAAVSGAAATLYEADRRRR
jgi:AcrR family transcriptional regulator